MIHNVAITSTSRLLTPAQSESHSPTVTRQHQGHGVIEQIGVAFDRRDLPHRIKHPGMASNEGIQRCPNRRKDEGRCRGLMHRIGDALHATFYPAAPPQDCPGSTRLHELQRPTAVKRTMNRYGRKVYWPIPCSAFSAQRLPWLPCCCRFRSVPIRTTTPAMKSALSTSTKAPYKPKLSSSSCWL